MNIEEEDTVTKVPRVTELEQLAEVTPRQKRIAIGALESALEHEDALRPVLVRDYADARLTVRALRALRDHLTRRIAAIARHPDEPGSRPATPSGVEFGTEDFTGFAPGGVY